MDIKDANPDFGIDTHVDVYDQEIKDIEAETQQTINAARCAFAALRRQWAVAVSSAVTELCSRV